MNCGWAGKTRGGSETRPYRAIIVVAIIARLLLGVGEILFHLGPVDYVPPGGEIIGPAILILQVVGVFPDVHTEERLPPSMMGLS